MSRLVLEIGPGYAPALERPGIVLQQEEADYLGLDIKPQGLEEAFLLHPEKRAEYIKRVIIADSAEMPLPDGSVSNVFMRDVFGEYTMPPELTGSNLDNTEVGIYEAFRVLEEGGQIAIAEEKTPRSPATPYNIGGLLLEAGFEDITVYPCQSMENPHWQTARTQYWDMDEPDKEGYVRGKPMLPKWSYIVCATRPQAETITFEKTVIIPDNTPTSRVAKFQKSARQLPKIPGDPYSYSLIKIVTKDGELSLRQHHDEEYDRKSMGKLFLY